jgi:MFS family permease
VTSALPVYVAAFILIGAPAIIMITGLVSLLQQATTDQTRGRVFGVFGAVYNGSSGAGMLTAGLLGDQIGIMPMLNLQAVLYLTAGATALLLLRNRNTRRPQPARKQPHIAEPAPTP